MKKNTLLLLTFVPIITGNILNRTVLIPGFGIFAFYFFPCITLVFWFYLGSRYSKTSWNLIQSVIIGNGIGFLCLLLYFWQFWWTSDNNRILLFAGLSQDFVANTNLLTAKYAMLFETEQNTISAITATAMQILGLLLMVIIFLAGYVFGKVKNKHSIPFQPK